MDLYHIFGLAMILYVVGFSIADHFHPLTDHDPRHLDNPDWEPVTASPAPTPPVRRAENLTRNRIDLMKRRKLDPLFLKDYHFTSRLTDKDMSTPESVRQKLDDMLQEMLRYLHLPATFSVEVIPDEDMTIAPDRAAECNFHDFRIKFFLRKSHTPEQLISWLCHECAHYFCYYHNMYEYKVFMLNEWYTDIVACLMGFSKYLLCPEIANYLTYEQLREVRWLLLQERSSLSAGQPGIPA